MTNSSVADRLHLFRLSPHQSTAFMMAVEGDQDWCFLPALRDHGIWEPVETWMLLRMLRPGMTVVDLGAHMGYFTLLAANCVGPKGKVLAMEPAPDHFRLLCANLLLNRCDHVEARRIAIANSSGRERLYLRQDNPGDHRLTPVAGRPSVEVQIDTLDKVVGLRDVDLIKIDTQGSEIRILEGMVGLIEHNRARLALIMEFAPGLLALSGFTLGDFAARLRESGAKVYAIEQQSGKITLQELTDLESRLQNRAATLLASGREDESENLLVFFSDAASRLWLARISTDTAE